MRIDKYLKNARIIKRRTVAKEACLQERIFLNGNPAKPGSDVKEGDAIKVLFGTGEMNIRVLKTLEHVTKDDAGNMYELIK